MADVGYLQVYSILKLDDLPYLKQVEGVIYYLLYLIIGDI